MPFFETFLRARRRRLALRALQGLSPQQRADIGIEPGSAETAVDGLMSADGDTRIGKPPPDRLLQRAALFARVRLDRC